MAKTETKVIEIKVAFADGIRAIAEGQEAIKNLTAEQKQLNLATAEGVKRNAEITAAIKSHKDEINQLIPVIAEDIKKRGERASAIDRHVQAEVDLINKAMAKRNQEIAAREKEYARFNQRKVAEAQKENETAVAKEQSELKKQLADKRSDVLAAVSAKKKEGYINQLKISINELEQEYYQLTEAELKSAKGTELLGSLKNKRAELMQLQQAYGNYTLNVGNYSSATKMLGINIGQVMKEMPNFAISARIGIMSLTNNLPMLAETIKQVRVEQLAMIEAGKKAPSMFSLISKSVFGLTGIMSIAMVLMQIYGEDIIKWTVNLFNAGKAIDEVKLKQETFNELVKNGSSEIKNAYKNTKDVSIALEEYKSGILTSDQALKIYNEKLGDQLGKQTDINEAIKSFNELGPKYLELQWKMAVVAAYGEKAAEAYIAANAAKEKSDKDYLTWFDKMTIWYGKTFENKDLTERFYDVISNKRRKEAVKSELDKNKAFERLQKESAEDALKFALENGLQILDLKNQKDKKERQIILSQFDYESKIMEERANAMEVGREKELAAIDADYNAKLVKSQQHIERLKRQEKAGVKGAKEARIQAEKDQEKYELSLEEAKGRKKIEINLKYDKLQADYALSELKHQHDMIIAQNELSAKEQYDLTVKNAQDEFVLKMEQLDLMNLSDEEYAIKRKELFNKMQLEIANGEKKLTNDLYAENQARLNNELAALTTSRDAQFQDIDAVYNKKLQILNDQKAKEVEKAGANAELIKSIEAKYAAESVALENWKITSKIDIYKFWADTVLNVGSEINNAISAFAEHELSVWAKTNEGKANFDVEYEKKKIDLQRKAAIREKALGVFSATINTAASIIKMLADPGGLAGILLSVGAGITGAAQIATILATPLPSMSSSSVGSSPKVEKKTVTEKFHTGGEVKTSPTGVETPATLLGGESVNTIATTQMFSPLLSALNQLGGGKAITSGVANTSLGTDMLASAFSKALRNMPAPILIMEEFEKASEKHKKIQNNRIIR